MYQIEPLSQKERDQLLIELSEGQRAFVIELMKRGRRTVFSNVLAKEKASGSGEDDIEEVAAQWELLDYIDAGETWQSTSELHCECGRPLRYQYIVQNEKTREIKKFGIKHFEEHTGIPPHLAKDIVKGIEKIDYELDEVLVKLSNGWTLAEEGIVDISASIEIPNDIQEHFDHDVPLLDRQVQRLRTRISEQSRAEKRRQQENEKAEREKEDRRQREIAAERRNVMSAKLSSGQQVIKSNIQLDAKLQLGVLVYIDSLNGTEFRAADVCNDLVKNHGAPKKTYSTGTLRIYPHVCLFLDALVKDGKLELSDEQGLGDRAYKVNDAVDLVEVDEKTEETKTKPEVETETDQLSLFEF